MPFPYYLSFRRNFTQTTVQRISLIGTHKSWLILILADRGGRCSGGRQIKRTQLARAKVYKFTRRAGKLPHPTPRVASQFRPFYPPAPSEFSFYAYIKITRIDVAPVFFCPFSSLMANSHVFQEISMCVIFFSVIVPLKQSISKLQSLKKSLRGRNLFSIVSLSLPMLYII